MIVIGAILIAALIYIAVLLFDAYLLSTHVPTVLADPSNFGAWAWVIVAVWSVIAMGAATARDSK